VGLAEILALWVILWLIIALHEAGHALGARLVGSPIREVRVGAGPVLARFGPEGTEITLRLFPVTGWCAMRGSAPPPRRIVVFAAGPAASALAAAVGLALAPYVPGAQVFGQINAALAVISLLPFPPLDGWFIALAAVEWRKGNLDPDRVYMGTRVIAWAAIGIFAVYTALLVAGWR
jgi:membrane-associated protease RseP (regulator of RpoE activity)